MFGYGTLVCVRLAGKVSGRAATGSSILSRKRSDPVAVETRLHLVYELTMAGAAQLRRVSWTPGVPVNVPLRTQHPLGVVVNRPSVWSDR